MENPMGNEKIVTPLVEPGAVISQAIPAIVESTKPVVVEPVAAPFLSQAPPMTVTGGKPVVDKASSVVAPTLFKKK
jgi:hypothetical protein